MKLFDIIFESVVDMYEGKPIVTRDEFIRRSKEKHGDKYNYDKVVMGNTIIDNVTITCPIHGDFLQSPKMHSKGQGCPKCKADRTRITLDDFIKRATEKHNGFYSYDNVVMGKNSASKVSITCPKHGDFLQKVSEHLRGHGCPKCKVDKDTLTQEEFIQRSKITHDDFYTYDNVNYVNNRTPVLITCPIHGDFKQRPVSHMDGQGCKKCAIDNRKITRDEFVNKSTEIHNGYYSYDKVVMGSRGDEKVTVTCPKHGDFLIRPYSHLQGQGCRTCWYESTRTTLEDFIKRSTEKHKGYYSYDNVVLGKNISDKVMVTCPKHGDFSTSAKGHLEGNGCPRCSESKGEKALTTYFEKNGIQFESQKKFKSCFTFSDKKQRCFELPFDFYLPEKNVLIEVDGEQHFRSVFGVETFERLSIRDGVKNKFVQNSSMRLIRLFYNSRNFDYLLSELERLLNIESSEKILLSKDYPKAGWNK